MAIWKVVKTFHPEALTDILLMTLPKLGEPMGKCAIFEGNGPVMLPEMNVVLIDAQGMEFEILTGMKDALSPGGSPGSGGGGGFDAVVVEVSHISVYEVRGKALSRLCGVGSLPAVDLCQKTL